MTMRIIGLGGGGDLPDFLQRTLDEAQGTQEHIILPGDAATLRERFLERRARRTFAAGDFVRLIEGKGLGLTIEGPMVVVRYLDAPIAVHETADGWPSRMYAHVDSDMIVGLVISGGGTSRLYREVYIWSGYCEPYALSDLEAEAVDTVNAVHAATVAENQTVVPLRTGTSDTIGD